MFIENNGKPQPKSEKTPKSDKPKKAFVQKEIKPVFSHFKGGALNDMVTKASQLPDKVDKALKPKKKANSPKDKKAWDAFSLYIRLRDADKDGICRCFTCGLHRHFRKLDCGHGIPRQHNATKFDEQNNHAQCKGCNGFEQGQREKYGIAVDKKYGVGTWDKLQIKSKQSSKALNAFEIEHFAKYYTELAHKIAKEKGITI
jgi:hypothetical protein